MMSITQINLPGVTQMLSNYNSKIVYALFLQKAQTCMSKTNAAHLRISLKANYLLFKGPDFSQS